MDLLPKSIHGFSEKSYWEDFFSKSNRFEWYGEYLDLCGVLHKYVRKNDKLLVVGCGNSTLSVDLYDAGYQDNTNIDISEMVIKQMTEKFCTKRPNLKYIKMDVKQMSFEDGQFNVVLDKGTVDALLVDASDNCSAGVTPMMEEIQRVLKLGGRFICISLLQAHVLDFILKCALENCWMVRIHSQLNSSLESEKHNRALPVFVLIFTKMKKLPGMNQILEFCAADECPPQRRETIKALSEDVVACQQYAFLCQQVNTKRFISEDVTIDLYNSSSPYPRYKLFVLDNAKKVALKFAVFIVPQGRESEWLFISYEGRRQLLETVGCQRLLVVHLSRYHQYKDLEEVKEELSQRVTHFTPPDMSSKSQSPFLSVEGHIGNRDVLYQGSSPTTGEYVIEDLVSDGSVRLRRLLFLSNQNVIQSEAKLRVSSAKGRKNKKNSSASKEFEVDHSFLACDHHKHMIAGLAFLPTELIEKNVNLLIIGLGGGGLPSYIQKFLPNVIMDVVEIDPIIVSIARKWFGLSPNSNLNLHIEDGLQYIKNCESEKKLYDAVMFDVNNDDASSGLSVPPPAFIEENILQTTSKILSPNGFFVLNLVCRNETLKRSIYTKILQVFHKTWFQKVPEELNEVLYATNSLTTNNLNHFQSNSQLLNKTMKRNSYKSDLLDTVHLMKSVSILT